MRIKYQQYEVQLLLAEKECNYTILQLLWAHNAFSDKALCAGVGKCAKCKIRFCSHAPCPTADEEKLLTQEEIDTGIRLSCKHNAKDELNSEIMLELLPTNASLDFFKAKDINKKDESTSSNNSIKIDNSKNHSQNSTNEKLSLAIDFGTTSLEYAFIQNGKVQKNGTLLNPMQGIGSEVMARLDFAQNTENAYALYKRTWECIQDIIISNNYRLADIDIISLAANSAMTYLALNKESQSLAFAPYSLIYKGAQIEKNVEFPQLAPVYIPPLLAPFVGADISAGLYALEKQIAQPSDVVYPYIYIDMGTNAEFALVLSADTAIITSVPLGPSLEGVGLSFGTVASETSIVDFNLTPKGLECLFINNKQASDVEKSDGICGVAYLHLLRLLKNVSLIDEQGHFNKNINTITPLAKKIAQFSQIDKALVDILQLPYNFYLSADDVENILKVKAAFSTAFNVLLNEANIPLQSLQKIYLAGTFGKYIQAEALTSLGFLPHFVLNKIEQVGNASLEGAKLLTSLSAQKEISTLFQSYKHIELANKEEFQNQYIENFNFKSY